MCDVDYRDTERKVFQRVRLGMKLTRSCNDGLAYQLQEEEEPPSHEIIAKQVWKTKHFINCVLEVRTVIMTKKIQLLIIINSKRHISD